MPMRVFVVGSRLGRLKNYYSGNAYAYEEMRRNIDERRDRILSKLDIKAIKSKEDYYQQLLSISYSDKKCQHAFENWAYNNYGNVREWFYEEYIKPKIKENLVFEPLRLKSGKVIKAYRPDSRSYVINVHYISRTGKVVEYLQRRDIETGRILPSRHLF